MSPPGLSTMVAPGRRTVSQAMSLSEFVVDAEGLALRHPQRLAQMRVDRAAVDAGRDEGRESRGEENIWPAPGKSK